MSLLCVKALNTTLQMRLSIVIYLKYDVSKPTSYVSSSYNYEKIIKLKAVENNESFKICAKVSCTR